jgi:DNA polymerase I-like protein with 3'-5' exonuclease and polymerase domains
MEDTVIHFVEEFSEVEGFFQWLSQKRDWLAIDTETGGLEFWKQPLRLVQIGDTQEAWVFRADRWLGVIEEAIKKYDGRWVGQNLPFDIRFLEAQGGIKFPWSKAHDTKTMAHLLNPNRSTSLKALGAAFLSPQAKRLQGALQAAMVAQKWGWADIPFDFPTYWGYGGADAILTARIAEKFWPEVEANYRAVYDLEMQVARICSAMEMKGVQIDLPYCEMMYDKIKEYCGETERWCLEEYGVRPSEAQSVATKLVSEGVDLSKTTPTGMWAMDKDVLEGLDHPLAKAVLGHRQKTKIGSTYFENFLNMHDHGVLHPSINTLGAVTGRMSIQNPALQTLPRGSIVRDAFVPRRGFAWVSADFDNIEMKLLAHFCQDQGMLEAARTQDMHLEMAKIAYQDPDMQRKDPRRQTFKNANFAKAYVAGVEKFSWTAGIPVEEGKAFLDFYDELFPGVKDFQRKVINVAKQRLASEGKAYVLSPLGRRHTEVKDKLYALVNRLIQGTAADAFKQSLIDLDNAGFGGNLLLPVHDEADLEILVDEAKDAIPEIERIMTQSNWSVPLTVSAEGPFERWGDKSR